MIFAVSTCCCVILFVANLLIKKNVYYDFSDDSFFVWPVNSISTQDTSFDDLSFLKSKLKNTNIVVLGESTHFDGSSFLAKTRLVKFLHEELNFNILAFEAGRYDVWKFNKEKSNSPVVAFYDFWSKSEQMQDLWDYIRKNNIEITGFDIQLTSADEYKKERLLNYLRYLKLQTKELWPYFYEFTNEISLYLYSESHNMQLNAIKRTKILNDIDNIIDTINKLDQSAEGVEYCAMLRGVREWWECITKYELKSQRRFEIRDSLMANNVDQIVCNNPDEKIILWTSNLHAIKNNHQYIDKSVSFINMGEIINNRYQNKTFTILFSNFCRQDVNRNVYQLARNNSLEYYLHSNKFRYCMLTDFNADSTIRTITGINQGLFYEFNLYRTADALFFIDTMENITLKNYGHEYN